MYLARVPSCCCMIMICDFGEDGGHGNDEYHPILFEDEKPRTEARDRLMSYIHSMAENAGAEAVMAILNKEQPVSRAWLKAWRFKASLRLPATCAGEMRVYTMSIHDLENLLLERKVQKFVGATFYEVPPDAPIFRDNGKSPELDLDAIFETPNKDWKPRG